MSDSLPNRTLLVVGRYPMWLWPFGFLSMAAFHFPLFLSRQVSFYKLMGCGRNGTFDIWPAVEQWAVMVFWTGDESVADEELLRTRLGTFIPGWWKFFRVEVTAHLLQPVAGHGTWNGRSFAPPGGTLPPNEPIGVLTRASIRLSRMVAFWSSVPSAAMVLQHQPGLIYSVGIGEVPLLRQATFSIWESAEAMRAYAYGRPEHQNAIRKTAALKWYSEEMFLRFRLLGHWTSSKARS